MYYDETDTPAMARTSNLNEELGQVCHITSVYCIVPVNIYLPTPPETPVQFEYFLYGFKTPRHPLGIPNAMNFHWVGVNIFQNCTFFTSSFISLGLVLYVRLHIMSPDYSSLVLYRPAMCAKSYSFIAFYTQDTLIVKHMICNVSNILLVVVI